MKALFKNRFPFVELLDSELTEEQLIIKRQYEKAYEDFGKAIEEKKTNQLREVHVDDSGTRNGSDRGRIDNGDIEDFLPEGFKDMD